ncbi:MurR/RpiR family transcriptional regulator [Rhodoferax sp.]|uniref:MurR/RpiR family transcriptional regulator n=1 Tax=Rhodoferax sp. TaxID=50421 RepID=UPI0025DB4A4E|nr:MurR/RpiR family transcriptional regulator [Rhodoferax sp.]MCM2340513.1 MurR/RpiR family transcriptional regulator [Rhodoferax sp.]
MPYSHLTQLLDSRFERLSPELQRAARWVQAHPAELGLQSMRQSALAAGVAPATMTRLARALGLDGFEAMRRPSMQAFAASVGQANPAASALASHPLTENVDRLAQAQVANLQSVRSRNSTEQLQAAAQAMLAAHEVLFLGLRASFSIAYHLYYTCDWLRANTRLATDAGGAWADQLLALRASDLLVVVSQAPYTRQTVEAAQQAHGRGVPVLALTDSSLSPLARLAQHALLFDTASPSFFHSMTGALALAEALVECVAEQGGAAVLQRLTQRQQGLQKAKAYWDKKPPRQE